MLPNPSPDQVVDALMVLRDAALQDTLETAWATSDVQVLAGYLAILRDAKDALRAMEVTLSLILEAQGADGEVVPGIGTLMVKRSMDRTAWRHSELIDDVVPILATAHQDSVASGIRAAFALCSPRWRIGRDDASEPGIRALGLDPDDYSVAKLGAPTVRIV